MLHSDRLQRLLWQLLPTTAIPLYKVATAGQANAATTMCTSDERSWLLALIAVCGAVSLFLNLESYERHWDEPEDVADDPTRSLYRKRWYVEGWDIPPIEYALSTQAVQCMGDYAVSLHDRDVCRSGHSDAPCWTMPVSVHAQ